MTYSPAAVTLDLSGAWTLKAPSRNISVPMTVPGDGISALLAADVIPDPYFGDNEDRVQWVAETEWTLSRAFDVDRADGWTLRMEMLDTVVDLTINGRAVTRTDSAFRRHTLDVSGYLVPGRNTIALTFIPAPQEAKRRSDAHPFFVPFANMHGTGKVPHINFLRKTQCDAGWDWGLCLMPFGVYAPVTLTRSPIAVLEHIQATQVHGDGFVDVTITLHGEARAAGTVPFQVTLDGNTVAGEVAVSTGDVSISRTIRVDNPRLWWPAGQGEQPLYEIVATLDGDTLTRRIGFRTLELDTSRDAEGDGSRMTFRVNGRDIFAKGANWIPADAIPGRITPEVVRPQLEAAVAAHMNMIRVWGGGRYEPDWFYDLCDELGLLIWHDLMFSCMPYPSDKVFLEEVRREIAFQVRRLSHRPSIALWCGDNEVIGSLTWFPETKANRDRFLVGYDRLSRVLADTTEAEDPTRRFWASSPSLGDMDFADAWHVDNRGDMHFWAVWHDAKPFEHYRSIRPRFVSEFGFQSFPSPAVLRTFATDDEMNVSSPVMEAHQRNDGGNTRIVETMTRYFRFPVGFENLVYLSQVQQALAIKTAVEYWRSLKPRCMGALYWQLNDCWPVASWASIEYGGGWKLLHHAAVRFFAPVIVVAVPDPATGDIVLSAVNDTNAPVAIEIRPAKLFPAGGVEALAPITATVPGDRAIEIGRLSADVFGNDAVLYWAWSSSDGSHVGDDVFFPKAPKTYRLVDPGITAVWSGNAVTLTASASAFFVELSADGARPSDNGFTLTPGVPKTVTFTGASPSAETAAIRTLWSSFNA